MFKIPVRIWRTQRLVTKEHDTVTKGNCDLLLTTIVNDLSKIDIRWRGRFYINIDEVMNIVRKIKEELGERATI